MKRIEEIILTELNMWDLSCSEEETLKRDLAKALTKSIKRYLKKKKLEEDILDTENLIAQGR